jgi:DNA-binding MarR family transcriptional regulator
MEMNYGIAMGSGEVDTVALWEHLLRFHRSSVAEMNHALVESFGHSLDEYDVLHQLSDAGEPLRMGDLADRLLVANSSCTRLVQKLVKSGHLVRRTGDVDRREILVALTSAGQGLHRRMAAAHIRDIEQRMATTFPTDVLRVLERVRFDVP